MSKTRTSRRGLTLMELVVVLVILIALAAIVVPLMTGVNSDAQVTTTNATMASLRNAVLQYYQDMKGIQVWNDGSSVPPGATGMPLTLRDLQVQPYCYVAGIPQPVQSFDPVSKRGWRGPYLASTTGSFLPMSVAPKLGVSLGASYYPPAAGYPSFASFSFGGVSYPGYTLSYLYGNPPPSGSTTGGDMAFLDGWGNPIVLQWPDASTGTVIQRSQNVRLVSAGAPSASGSSVIDTPVVDLTSVYGSGIPSKASRGNDIVLFMLIQDPTP